MKVDTSFQILKSPCLWLLGVAFAGSYVVSFCVPCYINVIGTTACEQVSDVFEVGLVSTTSVNCICCYPAVWSTNKKHFSFLIPQTSCFWVASSTGICYLSLIVLAFLYVLPLPL